MAYYKNKTWGKKTWVKAPVEKISIDFSEVENQMTEYHRAIQESVKRGENVIISAGPGTGKTWTVSRVIIPALESIGKNTGMVFALTNKNAKDFEKCIISPDIQTGTYHKLLGRIATQHLGNGNARRFYNVENRDNPKNQPGKTMEMARELFEGVKPSELSKICQLVEKAKMAAFGIGNNPEISDFAAWEALADKHSVEFVGSEDFESEESVNIIECSQKLMVATIQNKACADFSDMPYFVLYYDLPLPKFDFVVMDEAQDIPQILLEFLAKCAENGAQIIAVGDEKQSIFRFTGAIDGALDQILSRIGGGKCDLKVSYRVSRAAAELCNQIFPGSVIPWENAKEGAVENISFEEFALLVSEFTEKDVALSRTHKNLIRFAMEYIRKGQKFVYRGIRDWVKKIRKVLFAASRKANSTEFYAMTIAMDDFLRQKEEDNSHKSKMPAWIVEMQENISILNDLIQGIQEIGGDYKTLLSYLDILERADNDFDNKSLPTLSTIHAAKGGEWPNVYIIGSCISPLAKNQIELDAEKCCEFVAYSRCSDVITFVPEGK